MERGTPPWSESGLVHARHRGANELVYSTRLQFELIPFVALSWLIVELSDVHAAGAFPYIIPILCVRSIQSCDSDSIHYRPDVFELRDLNDNPDLQKTCGRLLAMITSITPSMDLIEPLMNTLTSIIKDSPVRHQPTPRDMTDMWRSHGEQGCTACLC